MSGFVSFVDSGPGDSNLLTLKAVARIDAAGVLTACMSQASAVVLYGALMEDA